MEELKAYRRAEEIIRRILDNGKQIAVFWRNGEIAAIPTNGKVCAKYFAEESYPLLGVYDEACPLHWLAADLQHVENLCGCKLRAFQESV